MTQPQPSSPPPTPEPDRPQHRILPTLLKAGAGLGGLALAGGGAALVWGGDLIDSQVMPLVEAALEESLDRPFELGNFERLTWNGVRLGPTTLPPTDEVATQATVEAVDLSFNWSELLLNRTLRYSLTFVNPRVDVVQAADGRWIDLTLPDPEEEQPGPVELELATVNVKGGQISVARERSRDDAVVEAVPIVMTDLSARAEFLSPNEPDLQAILFEANGRLGDGKFVVDGEGQLEAGAFNIALQTTDLPTTGVNLFLPPTLGMAAGTLNSNLTVALDTQTDTMLTSAQGTARLRDGEVVISQLSTPITDINSTLRFQGQRVTVEDTGLQVGDIAATATGTVDVDEGYDLDIAMPGVAIAAVTDLLETELPIAATGVFDLAATVTGALDQPRLAGRLQNQGPVQLDRVPLDTFTADFAAIAERFDLQALRVVPAAGGYITGQGQVDLTNLDNPALAFDLDIELPGDALAATYGASLPAAVVIGSVLAQGNIQGTVKDPLARVQFQLPEATYPGRGEAVFRDRTLVVDNTQFQVDQGTLDVTATARLDQQDWTAQLSTANLPVNRFTDQMQGLLTANVNAAGSLQDLSLPAIQADGTAQIADAQLMVPPGGPPLLEPGDWTTAFRWVGDGVQIERFSAPAVAASGFVAANLGAPSPIGPVDLEVQLSRYDLSRLTPLAPAAVRDQLDARGLVSFAGQVTGPLPNLRLAGNAQLDDLALNQFAFEPQLTGPVDVALAEGGTVALRGERDRILATLDETLLPSQFDLRLGDTVAQGRVVNQQLTATVENLPIDALDVAPVAGLGPLGGTLNSAITADLRDWSNLSVRGTATVLEPALDTVVADSLVAQFAYNNNRVDLADATLLFDDSRYQVTGWLDLASPEPEYYAQLDIVEGNFQDLIATLDWHTFADIGLLRDDPTEFGAEVLDLEAVSLPPPPFLEQLEAFAQFMADFEQRADATRIALPPLGDLRGSFNGTVTLQGQGFAADAVQAEADIQGQNWAWGALLPCDQAGANAPVGSIEFGEPLDRVSTGSSEGVDSTRSLESAPLGDRSAACNQFTLAANYNQGSFNISPLIFDADEAQISFIGNGSPENLSGQLAVSGVPVELAELFVDIPVEADGDLALQATLDGSLRNPNVVGDLAIVDPSLNRQSLESVALDFTYNQAHLRFDGAAVVAAPAEITLQGDIPYALPFMAVQPDTDLINIQANLENEGLQILNLVTDEQLRWEGGDGRISVQVGGTLANPAVVGRAQFRDGIVASTALSAPVTDLTGTMQFNLEQVMVETLTANYGGGDILISGRLPIQAVQGETTALVAAPKQSTPAANGLAVAVNQVDVNYEGFIEANLDGDVLIGGALLNPVVTGTMQVGDGRVRANRLLTQLGSQANSEIELPEEAAAEEPLPPYIANYRESVDGFDLPASDASDLPGPLSRVRLNDFNVVLTNDLVILGQPFYYISASGRVEIDGTLDNLQPSGVFTLDSGWVNLFSTQFRLVSNAQNTATFYPEQGLDPFLDVRMRARLRDANVVPAPTNNSFNSSEVTASSDIGSFGEVEFISVFATAFGYVSELQDTSSPGQASELLALTSRPSRSQQELVTLLTSSVINNIYGASLTQFAGFVGAGSLASFGDRLADTVGLRSFSIFPTTDTATDSTVGIGIGVEAAFDIGPSFGIDILEILNNGRPPQVGVSYRLNDQIRARGSTNLDGDNIVSVEYELRF
ncbi:translocation/assembly module TamB domain-containing protein [Nodosilinea sp. LEGE 07088]|uniref:translocation/assembly module TamB domain-containing protein n=1 Tax=Nodosilinea sp. LEGE 07088 TaxID=2777968 RepID=UPI00187E93A3|nr:translocation/assembly module TamB domain-containing protein [Nodosilinea sp. LEGE 07088]MBE9138580.1 translocation/assembly module TamB domain-containing protein [Nodosilinea sp. LEGE 07088]